MMKNKVFKVALLILSVGFLIIYYNQSQIGRYKLYTVTQDRGGDIDLVLDTKTGTVYKNGQVESELE